MLNDNVSVQIYIKAVFILWQIDLENLLLTMSRIAMFRI